MNNVLKKCAAAAAVASLYIGSQAGAAILLQEDFSYPDGALVGATGSPWVGHSGTAGQVNVASNAVSLTQAESQDVNAPLSGAPYTTGTLYAGFDVNFSALPDGTGGYFAHFKDNGTGNFRGRIFATTTDAAAGSFRLGVSNSANTMAIVPTDLDLGETHRLVLGYDTATAIATLYVNPTSETGGTVATDPGSSIGVTTFALRQSTSSGNGMGALTGDNLIISTTFAEAAVIPEPTGLALAGLAAAGLLRRRRGR